MSDIAADANTGLRKNYVSFIEDVAQSIGGTAPSGGIAALVPLVFATAGNATWFLFLLVLVAYLPITYNINLFASRTASPGGLQSFIELGLGRFWGRVGGWCYIIAMAFGLTDAGLIIVHYLLVLAGGAAGPALALVFAAVMLPLLWWIACRDIRFSTDTTLRLECVSLGLMLMLAVIYLFRTHHGFDEPQLRLDGISLNGLRLALVLAFFGPPGFESSTTLGDEAINAKRSIPRSLLIALLPVMVLYIGMSYILVACFRGVKPALDQAVSPFDVLAAASGLPVFGPVMTACFAISFFACILAALNAVGRVIYAMAREGQFFAAAGRVHPTHATPQVAITLVMIVMTLVSVALTAAGISIMDAFNYTAQISSFGFLAAYLLVCVAAPFFMRRRGELRARDAIAALLGVAFLILPFVGSLYPVPPGPEKFLPYIFLGLLCAGVGYSSLISRRQSTSIDG